MGKLNERLKVLEGTKSYQQTRNIFRNGKFYPYKDSEGFLTVGYGHLILQGESFTNGITEAEADELLEKDIQKARANLKVLQLSIPDDWTDFMIIMIFQLGLAGTMKFKKMIAALKVHDYPEAIKQAKDSLWYKQTPNRLNSMIAVLINK